MGLDILPSASVSEKGSVQIWQKIEPWFKSFSFEMSTLRWKMEIVKYKWRASILFTFTLNASESVYLTVGPMFINLSLFTAMIIL